MTARIAGDSLFLQRYTTRALSLMYLLTAAVVALFAISFSQYARTKALNLVLIRFCAVLAAIGILLRVLLLIHWSGGRIAAYVWADAIVAGTAILFWSLFGQVFDIQEGKQALGIVGACATIGCIITGFLIRPFVHAFGTSNLLLIVAFLVLAMAALVYALMWSGTQLRGVQHQARTRTTTPGLKYYRELLRSRQIRTLAIHTSIAAFVVTLIEFQFKGAAQARFTGPSLAAFFGTFYGAANIVGLLLQLFMVRQLLQGKRLSTALQILPGCFTAGAIAMLFAGPWAVIGTRFVGQLLQYGVDGAGMQMLYLGVRRQTRPQVRALAEGMCRPAAIAAAGAILAVASRWLPLATVAGLTALMAFIWLVVARKDYRLYVSSLLEAVNARLLDFKGEHKDLQNRALEEYLRKKLVSSTGDELNYVVNVVSQISTIDWSPEMTKLLQNPSLGTKLQALRYFAQRPEQLDNQLLRPYLHHPDLNIRREAVSALSQKPEETSSIAELISDPDPHVSTRAAIAAANHGAPEVQSAALQRLYSMISGDSVDTRAALAAAAGSLPPEQFTPILRILLGDANILVQVAAINTAGSCANSTLVPLLLEAMFNRGTSEAATSALMNCGDELTTHLSALGDRELTFLMLRANRLPAILATFDDEKAFSILERSMRTAGRDASSALVQGYCRIARNHFFSSSSSFDSTLQVQLDAAHLWHDANSRIESTPATALLKRAMTEELDRHTDNAFRLLTAEHPDKGLEGIRKHSRDQNAELRSEAIEVLEHVLSSTLSKQFKTLLSDKDPHSKQHDDLTRFAGSESPESVLLGVLQALSQSNSALPVPVCEVLLRHPSALVRQTTLYYLARTSPDREFVRSECERMSRDEDIQVASFADSIARAGGIVSPQKGGMMTVIEKILTLGRIPIFSELDTTALAHVSSCATEETFPANNRIIVEGDYGEHMFIVVDGSVEVIAAGSHIANLGSGDFVGEMSMLDGRARSASVRALTDCLLLRIDKEDFEQLLLTYPSAALAVIRTLSKRLREGISASVQPQ